MDNEQSIEEPKIVNDVAADDAIQLEDQDVLTVDNSEETIIELDDEDVINDDEVNESSELLSKEEGLSWYIVQCYALYEQKVRDRILQMQENEFKDIVFRVLLPEEETIEIKNNERKERIKKMFPGYLFVQMKPDEGAWYLLRRLPGVAKLVGTRNENLPLCLKMKLIEYYVNWARK